MPCHKARRYTIKEAKRSFTTEEILNYTCTVESAQLYIKVLQYIGEVIYDSTLFHNSCVIESYGRWNKRAWEMFLLTCWVSRSAPGFPIHLPATLIAPN